MKTQNASLEEVLQKCSISYEDERYEMVNETKKQRKPSSSLLTRNSFKQKWRMNIVILTKLRDIITKFAPQGPRSHRSEEAKVEYLYGAMIGIEWAKNALPNCYGNVLPWSVIQLYTALDSAWL